MIPRCLHGYSWTGELDENEFHARKLRAELNLLFLTFIFVHSFRASFVFTSFTAFLTNNVLTHFISRECTYQGPHVPFIFLLHSWGSVLRGFPVGSF